MTNGTLLDGEKRHWFEKNSDKVVLGLSVDGLPEMQRKNRGCCFEGLPVEWAHRLWPDQQFKMTVSKETLRDFADGVLYLQGKNFVVQTTLALGPEWSSDDAAQYAGQLEILSDFYLANRNCKPLPLFTRDIGRVFDSTSEREKCCNVGTRAITYDVDGSLYPCVVFSPLVFGSDSPADVSAIDFRNDALFIDDECGGCSIKNLCKTCYGLNLKHRGNLATRDKTLCKMYREEVRATCKFQRDYFSAKPGTLTERERHRLSLAREVIRVLAT